MRFAARPVVTAMVLALVLAATGAGCGDASSKSGGEGATKASPTTTTASKRFVVHLHADSAGSLRKIRVRGDTNLPDGAVIHVSASRAFRNVHESDVRAINAAGQTVTVSDGRFATLMTLDEKLLLLGLDDPSLGRIAVVDSAVTVCADFETGENIDGNPRQPDADVREVVGQFGERLKGSPQVTVFGSATPTPSNWLEVTDRVAMKSPLLDHIAKVQGKQPKSARLAGFCLS